MVYYRILNADPRVIQSDLVIYPSYITWFASSHPELPICPSPPVLHSAPPSLLFVSVSPRLRPGWVHLCHVWGAVCVLPSPPLIRLHTQLCTAPLPCTGQLLTSSAVALPRNCWVGSHTCLRQLYSSLYFHILIYYIYQWIMWAKRERVISMKVKWNLSERFNEHNSLKNTLESGRKEVNT